MSYSIVIGNGADDECEVYKDKLTPSRVSTCIFRLEIVSLVGERYEVLTAEKAMSLRVTAEGSNRYVCPATCTREYKHKNIPEFPVKWTTFL